MSEDRKRGGLLGDIRRTLTGNLVFAATQWALLIVVARMGSAEQVGYITLAAAIATPVFALTGLSLRDARSVDYGRDSSDQDYFLLRSMMTTGAVLLALAIIFGIYGAAPTGLILAALGLVLTKIPHTQSTLNYGIAQRRGRFDVIVNSQVLRGVLGVVCFAIAFAVTRSVGAGFLAQAICWFAVLLWVERRPLAKEGVVFRAGRPNGPELRRALGLMIWLLPLSIAGVLQMVSLYVPRIVLAEHVTYEALGLFGAIYYFLTAMQTVIRSISQASASRMAKAATSGNAARFRRITMVLIAGNLGIGLFIILAAFLVGEAVIGAIYGAEYVDRFLIIMVAITAALQLVMGFTQYALLASQHFALRLWINAVCLFAAIGLSLWLIPEGGVDNAAWVILWVTVIRLVLGFAVLGWTMTRPPSDPVEDTDAET